MKLTCCTWDCLLEHGAHSRHITQNRDISYFEKWLTYRCPMKYFWNILLNIFFSVQHMVSILNHMIFCIVYYANCTYWELVYLIGTYIVQGFDMKLWKLLNTALTFIWDPASTSMKLRMYQVSFLTDIGFCYEILKYALFLFLALVDDTPWWTIRIK